MVLWTGLCCTRHGHKDFVGPRWLQLGQTEDTSNHHHQPAFCQECNKTLHCTGATYQSGGGALIQNKYSSCFNFLPLMPAMIFTSFAFTLLLPPIALLSDTGSKLSFTWSIMSGSWLYGLPINQQWYGEKLNSTFYLYINKIKHYLTIVL